MPQQQNSINTGGASISTSPLPIVGCTGLYMYVDTDGNGGGNSSGTDQCGIYQMQALGPNTQYNDVGFSIEHNGSVQKIGTVPLTNQNLRVFKNGTTYGVPLLATNDPGAGNVRIRKAGVTYSLPNAAFAPITDITSLTPYSWSTNGPGGPYGGASYGWNYGNGGGHFTGQLINIFSKPYTITTINWDVYLYARGYGDNWQTARVAYYLYYTLNFGASWILLAAQDIGPGG